MRQCPGIVITVDNREAEVTTMAEGLFFSISKAVPIVTITESESKICEVITEVEAPPTVTTTCSKCGSRAIPYLDSSGKYIVDKCNVHGARLKVTHADIDAYSREKERKGSRPHGDIQPKITF